MFKLYIMKFLFVSILLVGTAFGQSIEENTFDKFDSVRTLRTSKEHLVGRPLQYDYLGSYASYMNFQSEKQKGNDAVILYLPFRSVSVSSLNDDSGAQIEFLNGHVKLYKHMGKFTILGTEDVTPVYFIVPEDDSLYTQPVKSIRIKTSKKNYDYTLKDKKSEVIKGQLALLKSETKK